MTDRLTHITTRTGDSGETGLADGSRVPKTDPRIHALGDVDELNSQIGVVLTHDLPEDIRRLLSSVQNDLFDLGSELAIPGSSLLTADHLARLDAAIAAYNALLPPLREFVLPGGCAAAAQSHVARTVCRRAERTLVALDHAGIVGERPRLYLNRLSDLLFILSRCINQMAGVPDVCWQPATRKDV
ncbi:MAG: cob(I)yrinic acid a,c-diamide adenosyltransferase [Burkholderiales bacterium]|jgi:cob(I)alamin adenosyltransferase|nr:cob(I)yrinic acid a,c-diamide adenosyltransferase [Betaproteobacteria bacterium]